MPADGSCFYSALARALLDSPDAVLAFGLTGEYAEDARHLRNWVASSLFTDPRVRGWLRDRLALIREVPELLEEFDFVREATPHMDVNGNMRDTLRVIARAIVQSTTFASEFEVTVMRYLLERKVSYRQPARR